MEEEEEEETESRFKAPPEFTRKHGADPVTWTTESGRGREGGGSAVAKPARTRR